MMQGVLLVDWWSHAVRGAVWVMEGTHVCQKASIRADAAHHHKRRRSLFVEGFRPRTPRQSLEAADEDDIDGTNGSVDSDTLGWSVATDVETAVDGQELLNKKIEDSHIRLVCFIATFAAWVGNALTHCSSITRPPVLSPPTRVPPIPPLQQIY